MDRVYKPITPTPLIFQNRSILWWSDSGNGSINFPLTPAHAEIDPPNFGYPGSFPSILGEKGEKWALFGGSVSFRILRGPGLFWGWVRTLFAAISDSWGSKFRPALPVRRATRTDARRRQAKHQFLARSPNTESTAPRGGTRQYNCWQTRNTTI